MTCRLFMLTTVVLLAMLGIALGATLKVPDQFPTIQNAIDASLKGDTVLVAPGTYVENIDFSGKAITVTSEQGANVTIITGNQAGHVITCNSAEGPDSVLDGFIISNGSAPCGGGMYCHESSPTVSNCIFTRNSSPVGGGMYNVESCPIVIHCSFLGNSADFGGGGIHNSNSNSMVSGCLFSENSAEYRGAGIYNDGDCSPLVTNCTFSGNSAREYGGGIFDDGICSVVVTYCTFHGNSAGIRGGGMYDGFNSTVINCTFYENSAGEHGGGLSNNISTVINCTFYANSAGLVGGAMYIHGTVANCILWNDIPNEIYDLSTAGITNSCIQGGYPGTGNIDSVPLFLDADIGDFHLTFNSPCRGSGDNTAVNEPTDFEGDPRIAYGTVDMGADEFYTHLYWTGDATPGGSVEVKLVGLPGTLPVDLFIGSGILDPPIPSIWGDWYLKFPIIGPIVLGKIPSPDGLLVVPGIISATLPPPYSVPMQELIGEELTNLCILFIN